jgi:hypothetical protein
VYQSKVTTSPLSPRCAESRKSRNTTTPSEEICAMPVRRPVREMFTYDGFASGWSYVQSDSTEIDSEPSERGGRTFGPEES